MLGILPVLILLVLNGSAEFDSTGTHRGLSGRGVSALTPRMVLELQASSGSERNRLVLESLLALSGNPELNGALVKIFSKAFVEALETPAPQVARDVGEEPQTVFEQPPDRIEQGYTHCVRTRDGPLSA